MEKNKINQERASQNKPRVVVVSKDPKYSEISKKSGIKSRKKEETWNFPYVKKNFIIAAAGLVVIIVGYILMATGITEEPALPAGKWNNPLAITVAPLLLILGYCVILPYSLYKFFGKKEESEIK